MMTEQQHVALWGPPVTEAEICGWSQDQLAHELRRRVICITRHGLHVRTLTMHAKAREADVSFLVDRLRKLCPAVVCLNRLPLPTAHWLLQTLDA